MTSTAVNPARAGRRGQRVFALALAALFAASAVVTIVQSKAMADMGGLPMRGGWAIAALWLDRCGQTWRQGLCMFMTMWAAMMTAMMLPSFAPVLWRLRKACVTSGAPRPTWLSVCAATGYLGVWMAVGVLIYPLGRALAWLVIQWPLAARMVPACTGVVVLLAGIWQFSAAKARWLRCCRCLLWSSLASPATGRVAWRCGTRWGVQCVRCSAGMTTMLLIAGAMDLRVMSCITAAMTLERIAPTAWRVSMVIGMVGVVAGLALTARSLGTP